MPIFSAYPSKQATAWGTTYFYNGQRDEQARRELLDMLAYSDQMLTWLIQWRPSYPDMHGLTRLATTLGLNAYALPLFRKQPEAERVR